MSAEEEKDDATARRPESPTRRKSRPQRKLPLQKAGAEKKAARRTSAGREKSGRGGQSLQRDGQQPRR